MEGFSEHTVGSSYISATGPNRLTELYLTLNCRDSHKLFPKSLANIYSFVVKRVVMRACEILIPTD